MKRRAILKYTALATGAAVSAPLASVLLSGCKTEPVEHYKPKFFQPEEFRLLKNLVDLILPKTDSPSAAEVGVHQVIDKMVGEVYNSKDKDEFRMNFTAFTEKLNSNGFLALKNTEEKIDFLQKLELSENPPPIESSEGKPDVKQPKSARDMLIELKQQTIAHYLTSEKIATDFLNYLPVPGAYQPCISLEEAGGKKWAI